MATRLRGWTLDLIRRHVWRNAIGPGTRIHPSAYIDRTWPRGIRIGAGCRIDEEAVILTHDYTRGIYMDTRIGDRTIVAARAIVMPGVTIGRECVVMPGAVVLRDVPDRHVAAGNPAMVTSRDG